MSTELLLGSVNYFKMGELQRAQAACIQAEEAALTPEQKEQCHKVFRYIAHHINGVPNTALRSRAIDQRASDYSLARISSESLVEYSQDHPNDITAFIVLKQRDEFPDDLSSPLFSDDEQTLIDGCQAYESDEEREDTVEDRYGDDARRFLESLIANDSEDEDDVNEYTEYLFAHRLPRTDWAYEQFLQERVASAEAENALLLLETLQLGATTPTNRSTQISGER